MHVNLHEEPDAGNLRVRFCEGLGPKGMDSVFFPISSCGRWV